MKRFSAVILMLVCRYMQVRGPRPEALCVGYNPKPLCIQVVDPQSGELSHVFVHASCGSKRVAAQGSGSRDALQRSASAGEPLMSKIQRQLLLQVSKPNPKP